MVLELRARAAAAALTVFGFNPGQRRGQDGRWIKMGGAGSAGGKPRSSRARGEDPLYRTRREEYNDTVIADAREQREAFEDPSMYPELDRISGADAATRDALVDALADQINARGRGDDEGYVPPSKTAVRARPEDPLYRQRRDKYNDAIFEYADKLELASGRDEFARLYREARAAAPGQQRDEAVDALRNALQEYLRDPSMPEPPTTTTPMGSGKGGARPGPDASYGKRRAALARSIRSGAVAEQALGQGAMGETRRFDLADGTSTVYKRAVRDWTMNTDRPPFTKKDQADAEELSALVGAAIGTRAPAVHRASDDEIYMELVDGQTAEMFWPHRNGSLPRGVLAGEDAIRIGLLDTLIENADRHSGNFLVDDQERLHPIDHGLAFSRTYSAGMNGGPPTRDDTSTVRLVSPFALEHFASPSGNYYDSNPLSGADVRKARRALLRLRGRFEAVGQVGWYESMMERFEHLASRAAGTIDAL